MNTKHQQKLASNVSLQINVLDPNMVDLLNAT